MSVNSLTLRVGQIEHPAFDYTVSAAGATSTGAVWEVQTGTAITLGTTANDTINSITTASITAVALGTDVIKSTVTLDDGRVLVDCIHVTVDNC